MLGTARNVRFDKGSFIYDVLLMALGSSHQPPRQMTFLLNKIHCIAALSLNDLQ